MSRFTRKIDAMKKSKSDIYLAMQSLGSPVDSSVPFRAPLDGRFDEMPYGKIGMNIVPPNNEPRWYETISEFTAPGGKYKYLDFFFLRYERFAESRYIQNRYI